MNQDRLPVSECFAELTAAVDAGSPAILQAPPGAGKTTGVPPVLLDCVDEGEEILVLQPRRIAARAAAHRLSHLNNQSVGQTYGYHVRFDRKTSAQTRVTCMTTGIFLQRLKSDPFLEGVGCVILDEFHERSLDVDLAVGMLHRIRTTVRPELRLVVMSATLDTESVAALLTDAVTIESHGRAYDVEVRYQKNARVERFSPDGLAKQIAEVLPEALNRSEGDVLIFLPGVGEIHRAASVIEPIASKHACSVFKLYGDLSPQDQDAVLAATPQRKIVLATNVAETSVTIAGITCVIDSGLARVMQYEAAVGIPSLQLQPISQASADQRAGRAGRTAPGVCYRLWSKESHRSRSKQTMPEVARADLSSAMLTLAAWGERDTNEFPWITQPTEKAVDHAFGLLTQLGAIDSQRAVTEQGTRMNALPVHPRLARLMLAAKELGCIEDAALAAALLSERDPFDRQRRETFRHVDSQLESDLFDRVVLLQNFLAGQRDESIHPGGARGVARVASQLQRMIDSNQKQNAPRQAATEWGSREERFSKALLSAFPDRMAKRRRTGSNSALMVGGRGVKIDKGSSVRTSELFLCVNVDGKGEASLVRMASAIESQWIESAMLRSGSEVFFHPSLKAVVARKRRYFCDLLLDESPTECEPDEATTRLLIDHATPELERILPGKDKSLQSWIDRWRFLQSTVDASELPSTIEAALSAVLEELASTRTSFKELSVAPWLDYLKGRFDYQKLQWFEQQAPESIEVPSGSRIRLEYAPGKPPILAVRIQEIFGWKQTPTLAGGRVPIQLHLLAPNRRPQQITEDLESFWASTYTEVRKELKRRYSKHHWPEDPATAQATPNGLKPRV